ncbi:MAG: hypothetical protein LBP83_00410 [Dysgonamonadaceae bacterium]|jgi:uncharacterized membrane protein|nr:hypothetical protein [Dysgonamonadaceae bacterium]
MNWYEIVLIVSSGLFLFSTIASLFFGEVDVDLDVNADFLLSDVISFKGLLHFAIGFSLTLTLMRGATFTSVGIGVLTGIIFVAVLYYLYKMVYRKLEQNIKYTNEIKEMDAEVYFWNENQKIGEVFVTLEGRPVTITLQGAEGINLEKGQKIKVSGTRQLVYPVNFII